MVTTPSDLTEGTVTISESEDVSGKYLLIQVPDFATDPSGDPAGAIAPARYGETMTSFLRLGVPACTPEAGDELVDHVYAAGVVGFTGEVNVDGTVQATAFVDDERNRGAGGAEPLEAAGHGMSAAQRYNWHTKHLKTKGGWRDHSDGNRISTTYGDKVEVIRGNYKLVVMGRQDDPGNSQGHEWSGNHVQDWGQGTMPGASVTLEWIQNGYVPGSPIDLGDGELYRGGAWLLINSTERVYQYSRNAGDFHEQQWGERMESYVGSETPERIGTTAEAGYGGHPTAAQISAYHQVLDDNDLVSKLRPSSVGLPRNNPYIIEKTWASKIESYTGTSAWWIPEIHEQTWATTQSSETHVTTSTETSHFGTTSATTHADSISEETHSGTMSSKTYAGSISELTAVGAQQSMTTAASITELTFVGAKTDITIAANQFELSAGLHESIEIAAVLDIFLGAKLEITAALGLEVNFGQQVAINCADTLDFNIGGKLEVNPTEKVELELTHFGTCVAHKLMGANIQIG